MLTEQISNGDTPRDAWMSWPEIDYSLVADGLLFRAPLYRCRYLGTTRAQRPRWLKENAGNFWRLEDLKEAPARLERPIENQNARVAPALPIFKPAPSDIRNGSDDPAVPVANLRPNGCSLPYQPTLPPTPAKPNVSSGSTQAELKARAEAVVSEVEQPKAGTDPVGAMGDKITATPAAARSKKRQRNARKPLEGFHPSASSVCELLSRPSGNVQSIPTLLTKQAFTAKHSSIG